MKKSVLTGALFMSLAATSAFAHHPAADIVDPEIYAMIDENVADTPHADLTFDDMGSAMDAASEAMQGRDDMDALADTLDESRQAGMRADVEMTMDSRADSTEMALPDAAMDTMTLLEDLDR